MNEKLKGLLKKIGNDFKNESNKGWVVYNAGYGGMKHDYINIGLAGKIEIGSFYQNEDLQIFHVLGKQYDYNANIILLCEEVL